ncbi:MAG: toxin, partial [Bacillus sp. (in: firmicutes)]
IQAGETGVSLKNFNQTLPETQIMRLRSADLLGEIIYLPEDGFNIKEAQAIVTRLDKLPSPILAKINQAGIQVHLFEGKLTDQPTATHLKGVIPRGYSSKKTWDEVPGVGGSKTVLVKIGASEKGNGHGSINLELHELAHSIDRYVYDEMRSNPVFLDIWNQEKNKLFPGKSYYLSFPEEYFAETFAMYYLGESSKQLLKKKAPKTFTFFESLS